MYDQLLITQTQREIDKRFSYREFKLSGVKNKGLEMRENGVYFFHFYKNLIIENMSVKDSDYTCFKCSGTLF